MIHYYLEGNLGYNFRPSWEKFYKGGIRKWRQDDIPFDQFPGLEKYKDNHSVMSDFVRWYAVLTLGGIYLDFDVELIKPIDHLADLESFVCIEGEPVYANGAVSGGMKGNGHHRWILKRYLQVIRGEVVYPAKIEVAVSPWMLSDYVKDLKGAPLDETDLQDVKNYDGFVTLPKRYFYPFNWNEEYKPGCITPDTLGVHWWKKGW